MQSLDPAGREQLDYRSTGLSLREHRIKTIRGYASTSLKHVPFAGINHDHRSSTRSNVLCPACLEIIDSIEKAGREYGDGKASVHYTIAFNHSYDQLLVSASAGCHLCSIFEASTLGYLRNGVPSIFPERWSEEELWLYLEVHFGQLSENLCSANLGVANESATGIFGKLIDFKIVTDQEISLSEIPSTLPYSTGDVPSLNVIREWLDDCQQNHPRCKPTGEKPPRLPKRLLKLEDQYAYIVDNTFDPPYVALSHCWGPPPIPRQMLEGGSETTLTISTLPRNFQDAITVTKKLGYEYLWIDSFCITQQSKEDWLEQSAVMASVYVFSEFTIACLASTNPSGGCFRPRNPLWFTPLNMKRLMIQQRDKSHWWNLEIDGAESQYPPLHTRAWVVQERVSAPRTVFYGSRGVYWECRSVRASEGWTSETQAGQANIKMSLISLLQLAADTVDGDPDSIKEFQKTWKELVQNYTRCNLTRYSDKLIALSGITKEIERASKKKYIQGLWEDNLAEGLIWHLPLRADWEDDFSSPDNKPRRIDNDLPTWTWASTMGPVTLPAPTGEVVWTAEVSVEQCQQRLRINSWKRRIEVDWEEENNIRLVKEKRMPGDYTEGQLLYRDEEEIPSGDIFLLLIQRVQMGQVFGHRCLVIQHAEDNQYKRIGSCTWRFGEKKHDPFPGPEVDLGDEHVILV